MADIAARDKLQARLAALKELVEGRVERERGKVDETRTLLSSLRNCVDKKRAAIKGLVESHFNSNMAAADCELFLALRETERRMEKELVRNIESVKNCERQLGLVKAGAGRLERSIKNKEEIDAGLVIEVSHLENRYGDGDLSSAEVYEV